MEVPLEWFWDNLTVLEECELECSQVKTDIAIALDMFRAELQRIDGASHE